MAVPPTVHGSAHLCSGVAMMCNLSVVHTVLTLPGHSRELEVGLHVCGYTLGVKLQIHME